jgi:hypothetical protein
MQYVYTWVVICVWSHKFHYSVEFVIENNSERETFKSYSYFQLSLLSLLKISV